MMDEKVISEWTDWLQLQCSPKTVSAYRYEIERFQRAVSGDVFNLSTSDLVAYLARLKANVKGDNSDATIYRATNALRSFYQYHQGIESIALRLPLKRPAKRVQRTLTYDEAQRLICSFNTASFVGRRNLALCALMLDSGLRAAEVCRLRVNKVDLEARLLWVIVKGGQEEFGAFSVETANFLSAYLAMREPLAKCDRVFVGDRCRRGQPLSPDGLRTIFRRIGSDTNIPELSPHVLRRTFATITTLLGAPTRVVQEAGRWRQLEQVLQYTRAVKVDAIRDYLPVSGIMRRGASSAEPFTG